MNIAELYIGSCCSSLSQQSALWQIWDLRKFVTFHSPLFTCSPVMWIWDTELRLIIRLDIYIQFIDLVNSAEPAASQPKHVFRTSMIGSRRNLRSRVFLEPLIKNVMRLGEFNGVMIKHNREKTETVKGDWEQSNNSRKDFTADYFFKTVLFLFIFFERVLSMFYPDTFEVVEQCVCVYICLPTMHILESL